MSTMRRMTPWVLLAGLLLMAALQGCAALHSAAERRVDLHGAWLVLPTAGDTAALERGMVLEADGSVELLGVDALAPLAWHRDGDVLEISSVPTGDGAVSGNRLTVVALEDGGMRLDGQGYFARDYRRGDGAVRRAAGVARAADAGVLPRGGILEVVIIALAVSQPTPLLQRTYAVPAGGEVRFRFHFLASEVPPGPLGVVAALQVDGAVTHATPAPMPLNGDAPVPLLLEPTAPTLAGWPAHDLGPLPASFAADLPCASCRTIRTRVNLELDGRYALLEQRIAADGGIDDARTEIGRWETARGATLLLLRGTGATPRLFAFRPGPRLRMVDDGATSSGPQLDYLLDAVPYAPLDVAAPRAAPTVAFAGTAWWLLVVDRRLVIADGAERTPRLVFDAGSGRLTGSTGCNRLFGGFAVDGESLRIEGVGATRMACPDGAPTESALLAALRATAAFRRHADRLDLLDAEGRTLAHWIAAP